MNYFIIKKLNYNKASDRLRIDPWLQASINNGYHLIYWNNLIDLLYIFYKFKKYKLVFLISKEFTFSVLLIMLFKKHLKAIFLLDICDLEFYKKGTDLRIIRRKILAEVIINLSDSLILSTNYIYKNFKQFMNPNNLYIIPDTLDIKFLPKTCTLDFNNKKDSKKIGWFGTSGYKIYTYKKIFYFNQSFLTLLEIIKYLINKNEPYEFNIFTDNINHIKNLFKKEIKDSDTITINLIEYKIKKIDYFFNKIDTVLVTYGDDKFMKAKSPNRLDTSLWLGKRVITFKEPSNWKFDYSYLNDSYTRAHSKKEIYEALKFNSNFINSRANCLRGIEQKEYQAEIIRGKILKKFL